MPNPAASIRLRKPRLRGAARVLLATILLAASLPPQAAIPVWGAKTSSPADTSPSALAPGQWIWGGDSKALGPMVVLVSLSAQRAYVYRNGLLVAVSTVSSGKAGHETPTGVFTILQKDKDHRSNKYNDAPMPYQERLTWDGIALHAGGLPGYPESHGCIHLPTEFARRLFDATNLGMAVVIAKDTASYSAMANPDVLAPVRAGDGAPADVPPLPSGEAFRWQPQLAPSGPVSLVLSRSDGLLVVLRDGVEIGRSRVTLRQPGLRAGTHAYVMGSGAMPGDFPQFPGGRAPRWMAISLPGQEDEAGVMLDRDAIDNVVVAPAFVALVQPLLAPGTVLVATDARIAPETTGKPVQVIDAEPPEGAAPTAPASFLAPATTGVR